MPTGDVKLPEVKLQRRNKQNCVVSLLSGAMHPEIKPMVARKALEPEEAFLPEASMLEMAGSHEDSSTAIAGRRAAYARLSVESLNAVCRCCAWSSE